MFLLCDLAELKVNLKVNQQFFFLNEVSPFDGFWGSSRNCLFFIKVQTSGLISLIPIPHPGRGVVGDGHRTPPPLGSWLRLVEGKRRTKKPQQPPLEGQDQMFKNVFLKNPSESFRDVDAMCSERCQAQRGCGWRCMPVMKCGMRMHGRLWCNSICPGILIYIQCIVYVGL